MVLMSDRRSEQRDDAVAGRLHDIAVEAMYCIHHQLQCGVDDRARVFRVEIRHQLGRALDVGEQRRHGLALALGQGRRVRLLRRETNLRGDRWRRRRLC